MAPKKIILSTVSHTTIYQESVFRRENWLNHFFWSTKNFKSLSSPGSALAGPTLQALDYACCLSRGVSKHTLESSSAGCCGLQILRTMEENGRTDADLSMSRGHVG